MDIILGIGVGLLVGGVVAYLIQNVLLKKRRNQILKTAETEGEVIKTEKIFQAKERFLELKSQHDNEIKDRESKLQSAQDRVRSKEKNLSKKFEEINRKDKQLQTELKLLQEKMEATKIKQEEIEKTQERQVLELSRISGLKPEDAKNQLMKVLADEARTQAMIDIKSIVDEAKINANQEAKKIILQSMQRIAHEQAIENAVTVFNLENDDMKGRIIGREGRNIRALETATGVEIIVDDTPEAILLSCFDPVRREVARLALHQLITDGRIHPARIEEVVAKTKKSLENEIIEIGKRTCIDLGIHGLHPELVKMVGRMKYRSSYGQNLLQHSRETANLAATLAAELGLNVKLAKRAGLLHDMGKVPEDEPELPHAILGMKLAEKYGEKAEVCNAIGAHHDEIEMTSLISPVVQVADAISGARPGARREALQAYINRIKDLEGIAISYDGVTEAYAIQAGRELRVIVESEKISDTQADELSFTISQRIQTEMTYPGQVKVTLIREKRSVNYAK